MSTTLSPDFLRAVDALTQALGRITEMEAELEELRKDKARLDWLEGKRIQGISTEWHTGFAYMGDLRAAIDAARAKEGKR